MSRNPGRETVTGITRTDGAKDRKGIPKPNNVRFTIVGCSFQPLSTTEQNVDYDTTIALWHLYAPPGTQLLATDGVEAYGVLYEVFGDPQPWANRRGQPDHVLITLRKARG